MRVGLTLGGMPLKLQRLDPDRRRRRLNLLAEKALRDRVQPRRLGADRVRADRLRELIASRRRLTG